MNVMKPQIFVSYSHIDADYVQQLHRDLLSGNVDCWTDDSIQTGDRLSPVIEEAISRSSLFFAYVTKAYLKSKWCMKELRYALQARKRVTLRVLRRWPQKQADFFRPRTYDAPR